MNRDRLLGLAQVFVAGVLYSTAGLFTRALHTDPWTILGWRAVFTLAFILGWMAHSREIAGSGFRSMGWRGWLLAPGIAFAAVCYIVALEVTTVADVMVIYATMPFVTAAVAWLWSRERPPPRLMVASLVALVGVAVMVADSGGQGNRLLGALAILCMNIAFAAILIAARRQTGATFAIYAAGTLLDAILGLALAPTILIGWPNVILMAGFGFSTALAMGLYMVGARRIPPAEVGLVGIIDVVIGPALVWAFFGEEPALSAVIGGIVVVAALLWHLWPDLRGMYLRNAPAEARGS